MEKQWIALILILFFSLGWTGSYAYSNYLKEKPEIIVISHNQSRNLDDSTAYPYPNSEKPSPYDHVKESQIHVYTDKVLLDVKGVQWAKFTDSNSMDPVIDEGSNALQVVPSNESDIHVGDIISYESDYSRGIVIHRVTKIGNDGEWYAIAQGDNNPAPDPGRVRFDQIKKVVIGVIY